MHVWKKQVKDFSIIILCMCSLEVSLEKQRGGMEWPNLREEEEEGSGKVAAGLPLQGPVSDQLSQQELEELRKKITKASKSEVCYISFFACMQCTDTALAC